MPTQTQNIQDLKTLETKVKIPANSKQTILTETLQTGEIELGENSNLTLIAIINKGWKKKQTLNFNFKNKNATLNFLALIVGTRAETFPFETFSNHTTINTNAYYHIRSALFDKSRIDYKGNLIIKPQAKITDCYLAHHSLMLSKDAKVETVPSLEIEADDVKAGHAATIGHMDEELIFYLKSRGLDEKTAKGLLIKSFLEGDINKITDEKLRQKISESIEDRLERTSDSFSELP